MRLLLPPSEGKRPGGRGRPLRERGLTGPLAETRRTLVGALGTLVAGEPDRAAQALLLPPGAVAHALAADAAVMTAPTMPALRRYAGVVYDALDHPGLDAGERRVAERSTLIFSGLWGVLRGDEPIPDYRVPAAATLPGVGRAGRAWQRVLGEVLPALLGSELVVDLRSTDYAAMWRPRRDLAASVVTVRVLSPLPGGRTGVVSFASKHGKGLLARALLRAVARNSPARSVEDVAAAWLDAGGADARVAPPHHLDLFTRTASAARRPGT